MIFGGIPIPMPAGCTPAVDRRRMAPVVVFRARRNICALGISLFWH